MRAAADRAQADWARRISCDNRRGRHILGDHGAGANHGVFADLHSWKNECPGADKGVRPDNDRRCLHGNVCVREVMRAGAKKSLGRHRGVCADFYRGERVDDCAFTEAGAIAQ